MPSRPVRLPDAMPEIDKRTLLVVCDNHRCKLVNVGGHSLVKEELIESKEVKFDERQGLVSSPAARGKGGMLSGTADINPIEKNRLRDFANVVVKRLGTVVREQKIQEIHLSAPAKFLSVMKTHLSKELTKIVRTTLDGNFVKEPVQTVLLRFRPDLKEAVKSLKEQENYSAKKQPPRKTRG